MIAAAAFILSIGTCMLLMRRTAKIGMWLGAAVVMFVAVFAIAKGLQDTPGEDEVASAYRAGVISYNDYQRLTARAGATNDYAGIAGAIATLLVGGVGAAFSTRRPAA